MEERDPYNDSGARPQPRDGPYGPVSQAGQKGGTIDLAPHKDLGASYRLVAGPGRSVAETGSAGRLGRWNCRRKAVLHWCRNVHRAFLGVKISL